MMNKGNNNMMKVKIGIVFLKPCSNLFDKSK